MLLLPPLLLRLLPLLAAAPWPWLNRTLSPAARAELLLAAMTLEEMAAQLWQTNFMAGVNASSGFPGGSSRLREMVAANRLGIGSQYGVGGPAVWQLAGTLPFLPSTVQIPTLRCLSLPLPSPPDPRFALTGTAYSKSKPRSCVRSSAPHLHFFQAGLCEH